MLVDVVPWLGAAVAAAAAEQREDQQDQQTGSHWQHPVQQLTLYII